MKRKWSSLCPSNQTALDREVFYASPYHGGDETFVMYGKSWNSVYRGLPKSVVQPPQIPASVGDYERDHPGWIDQSLHDDKQATVSNSVCHQCYVHAHYPPDCRLSYQRRKEVTAIFESLTLEEQERVPQSTMHIAEFASHAGAELWDRRVQHTATANQARCSAPQPTHILRRLSKLFVIGKSNNNHVNFLHEMLRLFIKVVDPTRPDDIFCCGRRNTRLWMYWSYSFCYALGVSYVRTTEVHEKSFFRENQLTPFFKLQVVRVTGTTIFHDVNDKPVCTVGSIKLYVHVGRLTELVAFLVCENLAVSAILGCNFCDQFVKCIYLKTRSVEATNESTVAINRQYWEQRSVDTIDGKCFKHKGHAFLKIQSTQRVRMPLFSQAIISVRTEREGFIIAKSRQCTRKRMECSAAWETQDVKRNALFCIIVTKWFRREEDNLQETGLLRWPKVNQGLRWPPKETTGVMLGVTAPSTNETDRCHKIPKEIQELCSRP